MTNLQKIQWLLDRGAEFHYEEREEYGPICPPVNVSCHGIGCKECRLKKNCMSQKGVKPEEDFMWEIIENHPLLLFCLNIVRKY